MIGPSSPEVVHACPLDRPLRPDARGRDDVRRERGYTVTAVDDAPALPAAYRLHPHAPNPFDPRTEIRFGPPEPASSLNLSIYDLAGRRVATLAEGPHTAGSHRVM